MTLLEEKVFLQLEVRRLEEDKAKLQREKQELLRDKFDLLCEIERLNFELEKAGKGKQNDAWVEMSAIDRSGKRLYARERLSDHNFNEEWAATAALARAHYLVNRGL